MPPTFQREGIEAAKEVRKRHPGTGVVILSQYDDPEYAIALLAEGAAGYAYLLKDRLAEGDQLAQAIREVATGGSMLDPAIVNALVRPVTTSDELTPTTRSCSAMVAEGKPIKAIAAAQHHPRGRADAVEALFLNARPGRERRRTARCAGCACCTRPSSTARSRARRSAGCCPAGIAEKLRTDGRRIGETDDSMVTVLMSDIRGYSGIAEHADPTVLAGQLNEHRARDEPAILGERRHGHAVRGRRGDGRVRRPVPPARPRRPWRCAPRLMHAARTQ